jgi:hypothetical protein
MTETWWTTKLEGKTDLENQNNYLDSLYHISNLTVSNDMYQILWLSDVEIDLQYKEGTSSVCKDFRCCHEGDELTDLEDFARIYGDLKCGTSEEGFKKLIKTINLLNQTEELTFESILYGGSSTSYDPANVLNDTTVNTASKTVYETLR